MGEVLVKSRHGQVPVVPSSTARAPRHAAASWQVTLAAPARCAGIALHTGAATTAIILPAPAGSGIRFRRTDLPGRPEIGARFDHVVDTALCTALGDRHRMKIGTIEHLMAALAGLGIDNAMIEVDGPEIPVMDGSSAAFVAAIEAAGTVEQLVPRRYLEILRRVEVRDGNKIAALEPAADGLTLDVTIDFPTAAIGRQTVRFELEDGRFGRELAAARTFGFAEEVEALQANGLARGGSLDNAVVVGNGRVLNPEGLRFDDEFVRHKALDALGDLYLAGGPIIGRFVGELSGHAMHNRLLHRLFAEESAWCWTTVPAVRGAWVGALATSSEAHAAA